MTTIWTLTQDVEGVESVVSVHASPEGAMEAMLTLLADAAEVDGDEFGRQAMLDRIHDGHGCGWYAETDAEVMGYFTSFTCDEWEVGP